MTEISGNITPVATSPPLKSVENSDIGAHYSTDMKVAKPKLTVYEAPPELPKHHLFSDKDATKRMQEINTDIYESSRKEKSNHGYSSSTYFKIFSGITLTALIIAGIRKFRGR